MESKPANLEPVAQAPRQTRGAGGRYDRLDILRGLALLWMAAFHFCFDLNHFGLLQADFYHDPHWTWQRTCILSTFLLCAGAGQAIAVAQAQSWRRFWRRWLQIAGCAVLVSVGSWWMFPDSYIYFGVLHGMAVMLIVARLMHRAGGWLMIMGVLMVLAPRYIQHPFFDTRATDWVGLVTHKPVTEDYVPLLPWLGVMLWGMWLAQVLMRHRPAWLRAPASSAWALPRTLGQWSLTFYMVHQPLLLGALQAYLALHAAA